MVLKNILSFFIQNNAHKIELALYLLSFTLRSEYDLENNNYYDFTSFFTTGNNFVCLSVLK